MVNMDPKFSDSPLGKPPPRARERVGWLNTPYMIDCDADFLIGYKNSEVLTSIDFPSFFPSFWSPCSLVHDALRPPPYAGLRKTRRVAAVVNTATASSR